MGDPVDSELFSRLNDYQMEAVVDESPACLVNAHVGSGKTTVLIAKIFYLHRIKGVPFKEMVVLTFTNKAANEIKERIRDFDASINDEEMPFFGTFHSVALRMLKTILPIDELGYTQDFTVIDPDEEAEIAMQRIMENSLQIKYRNKLNKRLEHAAQGQFFYGNMKYKDDIQALLHWLRREKIKQDKMNFDDLINNAIALAKEAAYRPQWIIVDEFHDSDEMQLEFIRTLAADQTKIFVVGDANQIIYSWRGSSQKVFLSFKNDYGAREISLPVNYRSCNTILEVAKCFLRSGSDLIGLREQGSKITIRNHYNPFNEAQYLCDRIIDIVSQGNHYKDIAIFYRLQRQSSTLEEVLNKHGIPYETSLRKTLKDIPVLGWFIKLIRFSVNNNDIDSAMHVLTSSSYGERFSSFEIWNIIDGCDAEKSVLLGKMQGFVEWCSSCECIFDLYEYFEIDNYINPTSASFMEDKQHILTLLAKIDNFIKLRDIDVYVGIKEFINSSALYGIDILKDDVHLDDNAVKLMTLHASKGLEFRYVFIIGANLGYIPMDVSTTEKENEERRLFFVGITRAKDFLELSYYTSPDDPRATPGASHYLNMIPRHLADREEMSVDATDLQALRREVSRAKEQTPSIPVVTSTSSGERKVKHPKYGVGIVVNENDDLVTVSFEGYGKKEFMKVFSELEDLQ